MRSLAIGLLALLAAGAACTAEADQADSTSTMPSTSIPADAASEAGDEGVDTFLLGVCIGVSGGNLEEATAEGINYNDDAQIETMREALEAMTTHCGEFAEVAGAADEVSIGEAAQAVADSADSAYQCLGGLSAANPVCTDQLRNLSDDVFALRSDYGPFQMEPPADIEA